MLNYLLISLFACTVAGSTSKPNFVIVLTDDQDVTIGGMTPMGNVQRFLANEGVTFENSYVASPICCPSRASILTGLYVHNHNTVNNSLDGGCYGASWMAHERRTFAAALNKAGYNTFYAGKYMNQYGVKEAGGPQRVPPGWGEWHGLVGNSVYYDYTISSNGVPTHSTDLYLTDVLRDLGVSYIENQTESQPFLMVVAPPAPHQPFTPAPRHRGRYANVTAVRQPNFNVSVDDKHWLMSMAPTPLPGSLAPALDHAYRSRWEALLAVDELVADLVGVLETRGLLDNTYFVYTSDNGYHIGQFSQVYDKRQPYESDVRVPLIIRGPNIDKNTTSELPVLNIDLAPTILKLAGVEVPTYMDGHPIDLENKEFKERVVLIEYHGEGHGSVSADCPWKYDDINLSECKPEYDCKCQDSRNNTYGCIRYFSNFFNIKYCQFDDNDCFEELYDLTADPYELENVCEQTMPSLVLRYRGLLSRMRQCTGANCDDPQPQGYYYPRNKCF